MSSERVKVGVSLDCTGAHSSLRLGDPYMAEGWGRGLGPGAGSGAGDKAVRAEGGRRLSSKYD